MINHGNKLAKILLPAMFILYVCNSFAQDVIFKWNDEFLFVRIQKTSDDTIYYQRYGDPIEGIYKIPVADIESVVYEGGVRKKFSSGITSINQTPAKSKTIRSSEYYQMGIQDAASSYLGYKKAHNTLLILGSLLTPATTVVPAFMCSRAAPKDHTLNYPDIDLSKQPAYSAGYHQMAWKMKSKQVWRAWQYSVGISITFAVLFLSISKSAN